MKKIFAAILFLAAFSLQSNAQRKSKLKVPENVQTAFTKQYNGAVAKKWDKEDGNYEVSFEMNGKKMSALFEPNGNMVESEAAIDATEVPSAATDYIKANYKGKKVKEYAKITKRDGTVVYEAEIGGKDVLFDADGKVLK
jgi:hypothetical protein